LGNGGQIAETAFDQLQTARIGRNQILPCLQSLRIAVNRHERDIFGGIQNSPRIAACSECAVEIAALWLRIEGSQHLGQQDGNMRGGCIL